MSSIPLVCFRCPATYRDYHYSWGKLTPTHHVITSVCAIRVARCVMIYAHFPTHMCILWAARNSDRTAFNARIIQMRKPIGISWSRESVTQVWTYQLKHRIEDQLWRKFFFKYRLFQIDAMSDISVYRIHVPFSIKRGCLRWRKGHIEATRPPLMRQHNIRFWLCHTTPCFSLPHCDCRSLPDPPALRPLCDGRTGRRRRSHLELCECDKLKALPERWTILLIFYVGLPPLYHNVLPGHW